MIDRLLGVVCILAAACMAWSAQSYAAAFSYEPLGPRAFPLLLAVLLAAGGAWLVFKPSPAADQYVSVPFKRVGVCLVAVFLYALCFEHLGFPLATALMTIPLGLAFGGTLLKSALTGVVLGVSLFFLFDRLLDVVLPAGLLAPWLMGA